MSVSTSAGLQPSDQTSAGLQPSDHPSHSLACQLHVSCGAYNVHFWARPQATAVGKMRVLEATQVFRYGH
eukprot:4306057-Pyramimonas_sp.AAC.1